MKYVLLFVEPEEFAHDVEAMGPARDRRREERNRSAIAKTA
jgi:hypothetical protein